MINYKELLIPENDQNYYIYYKFEFNSNTSYTRFRELALFSTIPPPNSIANLTDGDTSTYFENPVAIVVDLGEPPVAVNKMIINNADDSDVARIEALQHTRLVATDDDRIKQSSYIAKCGPVWNYAIEQMQLLI